MTGFLHLFQSQDALVCVRRIRKCTDPLVPHCLSGFSFQPCKNASSLLNKHFSFLFHLYSVAATCGGFSLGVEACFLWFGWTTGSGLHWVTLALTGWQQSHKNLVPCGANHRAMPSPFVRDLAITTASKANLLTLQQLWLLIHEDLALSCLLLW